MTSASKKLTSILFASLAHLLMTNGVGHADSKVEIRFVAATASYRGSLESNQPVDFSLESAAYDALWRGVIKNNVFTLTESEVLAASGSTRNVFKIGGGSCSGTLSANSDGGSIPFGVVFNGANRGQINIQLPHIVANTGLNAFIMDKNQPDLSTCRTAGMQLARATCFNPTRDCFTIGGSISPLVPQPGDTDEFQKFFTRKDAAIATFNPDSPNASIPFSYTANNDLFDHLGNKTDTYKVVWAGYLTISEKQTTGTPPAVNPYKVLNFDPTTLVGPPPDVTPPSNPFGGTDDGFDSSVLNSWLKNFNPIFKSFSQTIQALNSVGAVRITPRTLVGSVPGISFDTDTRAGTLNASAAGSTPASGVFQIKIKALVPEKAEGYKLTISKKYPGTTLIKGADSAIAFTIDAGSLKLMQSGKAAKVFFAIRFTPSSGKKTFEKQFVISLKKRKS